jgi:hypothetical protein
MTTRKTCATMLMMKKVIEMRVFAKGEREREWNKRAEIYQLSVVDLLEIVQNCRIETCVEGRRGWRSRM